VGEVRRRESEGRGRGDEENDETSSGKTGEQDMFIDDGVARRATFYQTSVCGKFILVIFKYKKDSLLRR